MTNAIAEGYKRCSACRHPKPIKDFGKRNYKCCIKCRKAARTTKLRKRIKLGQIRVPDEMKALAKKYADERCMGIAPYPLPLAAWQKGMR